MQEMELVRGKIFQLEQTHNNIKTRSVHTRRRILTIDY